MLQRQDDERPVHVVPDWGPEHDTDGGPCWCKPEVRREAGSADVVIHREPGN